jgi:glycosyltransferase involved in cell wall biosynthesis
MMIAKPVRSDYPRHHKHLLSELKNPEQRTLKICHMCAALEGATWMVEQLRELRERFGHDVYACVIREDCDFADRLRAAGIKCLSLEFGYRDLKQMALMPLTIVRLARLLRRERFDVLQTHLIGAMVAGRIAAWLADVPVRLAMIGSPWHLEARISRYIDRATAWMESGVIASCEQTVTLYQEIGVRPKKIFLIYYGPDERKFDPESPPAGLRREFGWPSDTPLVALVAYFYQPAAKSGWVPERLFDRALKGHEDFVEAVRLILREFPNARFLLVGRGFGEYGEKYRQQIISLVNSLSLQDEIIFTGHRYDVNRVLRDVDVTVQAPLIENLGGTIEALLMRRPLVATRVGGIPDSVRDGETGILVAPGDPNDLARGILQMLRNPQEAERLARNGRELMLERFTLTRTIDDLNHLYQTLRSKKTRRSYNLLVSSYRQLLAVPVYAYLGFRVIFIEYIVRLYAPIYVRVFYAKAIGYGRAVLSRLYWKGIGTASYLRNSVYAALGITRRKPDDLKDR